MESIMTGITRRSVKQQRWWHIILLAVVVVTVLLPFCAAQEANADKPTPTFDPQQEQALRQLVQGYVRAEKKTATYENVLEKVKLILPHDNAQGIEQIVQEALQDAEHVYADRLILDMLQTVHDPDCMEREFDASSPESFNATDAAAVLHKCKLLVLRNVFDPEFLSEYKANFTGFVQGLKNGEISREGSTTNNEGYFLHKLDHGRWEVLLPQNFAHATVVSNPTILNVLMNDRILGPDLVLHSLGTALADSGARHQDWHTDSDFLFADTLYKTTGVSQHELPAYAITMMVPLLHMTPQHGPTQFCMGSSNLAGLEEDRAKIELRNESLRQHINDQPDLGADVDHSSYKYMRTPLITFGDVLLFDYQIIHRGTQNVSPDLRAMLYLTYSRFWYKDQGFEEDDEDTEDEEEEDPDVQRLRQIHRQLTRMARYAVPDGFEISDEYDDVESADWKEYGDEEGTLEGLRKFGIKKQASLGEQEELIPENLSRQGSGNAEL